jgi:hypothetical protein
MNFSPSAARLDGIDDDRKVDAVPHVEQSSRLSLLLVNRDVLRNPTPQRPRDQQSCGIISGPGVAQPYDERPHW